MSYKVVFTDYDFENIDIEKEAFSKVDCALVDLQSKDEATLISACFDADALIVQYAPITSRLISSMDKCKVISRYGIGVDNVDLEAATAKNIPVCNVPDYCINEVADHTLSLMLSLLRKIIPLFNSVKNRSSSPGKAVKTIYNLKKLTLGFVGLGKIPQNLYEKVKPIFNNIIVYDPYIKEDVIKKYNFNQVSFINLLKTSDIISIHCPFVDETYHLFSDSQFQLMKHTSYIVNTARGPIIDTSSLYQAIINRQIAGAALDVWEEESIGMVYDLAKLDNVIITPHVAYYSESSQKDVKYKAALNVIRILSGEKPKHVVNK